MNRTLQPEILDVLPAADPRAIRSRRDLQRVNTLMGNRRILSRTLKAASNGHVPQHVLELGAGDGRLLLQLARELAPRWPHVEVTLIDQRDVISSEVLAGFRALGWRPKVLVQDVRQWIQAAGSSADVVLANLFLHHFSEEGLSSLLQAVAAKCDFFAALEPRRGAWPFFCSRLLWMMGCNDVTCYDAPVSVKAGFSGKEISALWPQGAEWELRENGAGLFSHLFVARRKD